MSVFLIIAGVLIGIVGMLVPAIFGAALIISGAVLFAAGFIVGAIQEMHTTLALGQTTLKMNTKTQRQCPECREIVRIDARRCKFCAAAMEPPPPPPVAPPAAPTTVPAPRQVNPKQT